MQIVSCVRNFISTEEAETKLNLMLLAHPSSCFLHTQYSKSYDALNLSSFWQEIFTAFLVFFSGPHYQGKQGSWICCRIKCAALYLLFGLLYILLSKVDLLSGNRPHYQAKQVWEACFRTYYDGHHIEIWWSSYHHSMVIISLLSNLGFVRSTTSLFPSVLQLIIRTNKGRACCRIRFSPIYLVLGQCIFCVGKVGLLFGKTNWVVGFLVSFSRAHYQNKQGRGYAAEQSSLPVSLIEVIDYTLEICTNIYKGTFLCKNWVVSSHFSHCS